MADRSDLLARIDGALAEIGRVRDDLVAIRALLTSGEAGVIPAGRVIGVVSDVTGVPFHMMASRRIGQDVARPRNVCWVALRRYTLMSHAAIGRRFGGRDHSTVVSGERRGRALTEKDREARAWWREIDREISRLERSRRNG